MIRIIEKGEWKPTVFRFKCERCGTVWECDDGDNIPVLFDNYGRISYPCPVCKSNITVHVSSANSMGMGKK